MPRMKQFGDYLSVAVTPEMKSNVEKLAAKQNRLPADVVRTAVQAYLTKEANRKRGKSGLDQVRESVSW